jgi:hypothetical protein
MPHLTLSYSFIKISTAFVTAKDLSATARAVYCRLRTYYNRNTGQCNPRRARLATDLGVSESTIKRGLGELRRTGWIVSHRRLRGRSYELLEVASPPRCSPRVMDDPSPRTTGDPSPRVKNDPSGPAASLLTEPDLFEPEGKECAAVKATSCMVPKKPPAAAAPLPPFGEPEHPASPPDPAPAPAPAGHASDPIPALARAMAGELLKVHPQPGLAKRAAPEIERILRAAPNLEATGERIWNNHAAWMEYWRRLEFGRFIPQLWRWFSDGDWENPPVIRKPMTKDDLVMERFMERERRRAQA